MLFRIKVRSEIFFRNIAASLPKNRYHRTSGELFMVRDDECLSLSVDKTHQLYVASALTRNIEIKCFENADHFGA